MGLAAAGFSPRAIVLVAIVEANISTYQLADVFGYLLIT
jgi:hypothetical protein